MRRICAALATVLSLLLVSIALAEPAVGKGPESVTISGPGLDEPIDVLGGTEAADAPSYLVVALTELTNLWETSEAGLTPEPHTERLHERYTLTGLMARPSEADPDDYTVRQDLYPNVAFGGPAVYIHPSRYLRTEGGWFQASPALRDTLSALGIPVRGVPAELARRETGSEAEDQGDPAIMREIAMWPTAAAAAGGIGVGLGAGWVLSKRRTRGQLTAARAA
jgi:hypothetical protein